MRRSTGSAAPGGACRPNAAATALYVTSASVTVEQVDELGAVGERRLRRSRRLDGEPSLPTASDSREGYEPVRVQFDGDCVHFPAAADERRPGLRQAIAPRLRSP